jgi:hypothetical protein
LAFNKKLALFENGLLLSKKRFDKATFFGSQLSLQNPLIAADVCLVSK